MNISIEQQKTIEQYIQRVIGDLQDEKLTASSIDQLSDMLREQIHEALADRVSCDCTDEALSAVLADMPLPDEFAVDAANAAGAELRSTRASKRERGAILLMMILTFALLLACVEGLVWSIKSTSGGRLGFSTESFDSSDQTETVTASFNGEAVVASSSYTMSRRSVLPLGLGFAVAVVCLMGFVVALIVLAGGMILIKSLAAGNVAVAQGQPKSWVFMRLCILELVVLGGALIGMSGGLGVWYCLIGNSWRPFAYSGLSAGTLGGVLVGVLALKALTWTAQMAVRIRQRRLPAIKLAVLGKMESIVSGAKQV